MNTTKLRELENLIKLIRNEMGEGAPIQQVAVLLAVARAHQRGEDIEVLDIGKACGLSSASTSRNLAAIGDWHWRQKPGAGLVRLDPMLSDRRRKLVRLTRKGQAFIKKLEAVK